ncbi:uncharacterized protein PHACADRAFT_258897 [Phanerochaete carnosa HHB-10118-sp]|uniref:Uncharacterized protein n=1 Tax=Phanerochaete carnosa (strain HHB-10118-sp) TaxID=650164 RepID=K5W779_PHACS|nr:uncharacterized protein PHACADRAFT_258897 [Phanerochaete carnosa HHB-10118-sp]EKM54794.1 hypothetical protein PHACADRAFT_258897 [Phanerochaete carnosa HHB-10118-sp]
MTPATFGLSQYLLPGTVGLHLQRKRQAQADAPEHGCALLGSETARRASALAGGAGLSAHASRIEPWHVRPPPDF